MGTLKSGDLVRFTTTSTMQLIIHVWTKPDPPNPTFVVSVGDTAIFLGRTKGKGLAKVLTSRGLGFVKMENVGCADEKRHLL